MPPRNVVTISDMPPDLQDWLMKEAHRRSEVAGKRVYVYQLITQAIREYKDRAEAGESRELAGVNHG